MIGLIQKILLDLVETAGGTEAVLEVKRRAEVPADKTFHLDAAYSDDEFRRLFAATCGVLKITPQQAYVASPMRLDVTRWRAFRPGSPCARRAGSYSRSSR